jgi:alkylation response protein AidB-like acyl-CoA dehydrogenase
MLPHNAMLGTSEFIPRPMFMASLFRVAVGSATLTSMAISAFLLCVTIGARYSLRRTVLGSSQTPTPIITFRTQQIPIFTALAQAHVLRAFDAWSVTEFMNAEADPRVRHGIAACFKVAAVQLCQASNLSISERCGAQGLFDYNQISGLHVRASLFDGLPFNHVRAE